MFQNEERSRFIHQLPVCFIQAFMTTNTLIINSYHGFFLRRLHVHPTSFIADKTICAPVQRMYRYFDSNVDLSEQVTSVL